MAVGFDQAIALVLLNGDPARSIAGLAAFAGFTLYSASASASEIHIAEEPPDPDTCVTVILEAGGAPTQGSQGLNPLRRPAVTIRTRAAQYGDAERIAFQVYRILDGFEGNVNSVPIFRVDASTEPLPLGRDREERGGRWVFTHTFNAQTKRYDPS